MTAEEVAVAVGIAAANPEPDANPLGADEGCDYTDQSGERVLSYGLQRQGGASAFETWRGEDTVEVDGIGDGALWVIGGAGIMMVLKGDALLKMTFPTFTKDEAAPRPAAERLARAAAGRM